MKINSEFSWFLDEVKKNTGFTKGRIIREIFYYFKNGNTLTLYKILKRVKEKEKEKKKNKIWMDKIFNIKKNKQVRKVKQIVQVGSDSIAIPSIENFREFKGWLLKKLDELENIT